MALDTPVALLVFNRPDLTRLVVDAVRQARPPILLVVADGPRQPVEVNVCNEAREAVLGAVDWECEVRTNFSDTNLGCRARVSSGLDWVFDEVGEAIVLEDDCVPLPSFFSYCESLLEHHRTDPRVMHVGGSNLTPGHWSSSASYRFSRYTHVWGWATWRRAWDHYDVAMRKWPQFRDSGLLEGIAGTQTEQSYFRSIFGRVHAGEIDTWDYQWEFACWAQSGLATVPKMNLVTNVGFRPDGTHTHHHSPFAGVPATEMSAVHHPDLVARDAAADRAVFHLESGLTTDRDGLTAQVYARARAAASRILRR